MKTIVYLCMLVSLLCVAAILFDIFTYRVGMTTFMTAVLLGMALCGITNNWSEE